MKSLTYSRNNYACGVHAFQNAVAVLGVDVDYDLAKLLIGTKSRPGTSEHGIVRGIKAVGLHPVVYSTRNTKNAWAWLNKWARTHPIILAVDWNEHWVSTSGVLGRRVIIADPSPRIRKGENGVYVYNKTELMERWKYRVCYAIRVQKSP